MSPSVLHDPFEENIELVGGKPRALYEAVPSVRFRKESLGLFSAEVQDWFSRADVTLVVGQDSMGFASKDDLEGSAQKGGCSDADLHRARYPTRLERLVVGFAEWAGWLTTVDDEVVHAFLNAPSSPRPHLHRRR